MQELLPSAGRNFLAHSAPRIWQVQGFPSYLSISSADQVVSDHRFHVLRHTGNQSQPHTHVLSFPWVELTLSHGDQFSKKLYFYTKSSFGRSHHLLLLICTLRNKGSFGCCQRKKDFWYPDVPLEHSAPLCCRLGTPASQLRGQVVLSSN